MASAAGNALGGAAKGAAAGAAFGPWGAVIGGAVGLGASLISGNKAAKKRRKMEGYLDQQDAENTAWYNSNMGDYTQRSDVQGLMKTLRDNLALNNKRAANTAVVTGATPEAQAVAKEQANKVISDTYSNIGAMGQQWKDQVTNRYLSQRNNLANMRMNMLEGGAQSNENVMNTGLNLLGTAATSYFQNK